MDAKHVNRRILQLHLRASQLLDGLDSGNYRSLFKGFGLEFSEVRNYVPGDDPRLIDWKVSSRMGSPYSKVFQEERELTVMLMLDLSSSMFVASMAQSKIDMLVNIFALVGFAATHNGDRVGSLFFSDTVDHYFQPKKDSRYLSQQLSALLKVCQQPDEGRRSNLAHACRTLYERASRRGSCVILSDFRSQDYQAPLSLLSRRHDLVMIRLVDPLDYEFPPLGIHTFRDVETSKEVTVLGHSPRMRHNYALYWERRRREWLSLARRQKIPAYEISTQQSVEEKLLELFSPGRKRR